MINFGRRPEPPRQPMTAEQAERLIEKLEELRAGIECLCRNVCIVGERLADHHGEQGYPHG